MFQQAGTAQLNDYFRPLSERGGSRVFFCRIAGYGETVAAFLRRYYEAARRSGVIIDGRIPNPTPDNLSYFNEMMGSGFQMDRDFLSQRLKKWLPRMTDGQRDAVVTAMYATLDDMRRAGKNDNMLRNAYMKYMCWLYYKFERIVNVLGGETLPKILYAGDVSHYELQLLTVLSRAGADIVLLECGGDQAYLTVDPQSALSHLYQAPGLGSFPAGFGVKQLQAELEREVRRQRLYGTPPSLSPCTNAWVQKAELNAALTAVQARGNDPRFFCNLFLCQYGVEDNLTYTNDLFAFYQSLQGGAVGQKVVNEQHLVPRTQELLGHDDVIHPAVGKGLHLRGVHLTGDVLGLVLLGKDHRTIKKLRGYTCDPDPRCLDGQNLGNPAVPKQAQELLAHFLEQLHVHLMIQKAVHLQHAAFTDFPVGPNALLQQFHYVPLLTPQEKVISIVSNLTDNCNCLYSIKKDRFRHLFLEILYGGSPRFPVFLLCFCAGFGTMLLIAFEQGGLLL